MRNRGFSTTDLLIAVTVLALMAVLAVPRYVSLNTEIRVSAVRSLASNVDGSARLAHKVWRTTGRPDMLNIDGQEIEIQDGYPTVASIRHVIVSRTEFIYANGQWLHKERSSDSGCAVIYVPPVNGHSGLQVIAHTIGC